MSVREHWINVRVNPEELARIREKQKELGYSEYRCLYDEKWRWTDTA